MNAYEKKVIIIAVSDIRGAIYNPDDLDEKEVFVELEEKGTIVVFPKAKKIPLDEVVTVPCDIIAPCAKEDMITLEIAKKIKDRIIAEGENMAISPDAQIDLHKQGKLYIPDFIANAGGVIGVFVE